MPKITKVESAVPALPKRKRVCAYARVSMETDRLAHSLSAQIGYYSSLIQKNPEWEYAGVYADSFVSGTGAEHRAEFRRMLAECEKGCIEIFPRTLIQCPTPDGVENGLKQGLSADLSVLPKALFFCVPGYLVRRNVRLNPLVRQNKKVRYSHQHLRNMAENILPSIK